MLPDMNWEEIKHEMVHYLRRLIRIDTSPGRHGETMAVCFGEGKW